MSPPPWNGTATRRRSDVTAFRGLGPVRAARVRSVGRAGPRGEKTGVREAEGCQAGGDASAHPLTCAGVALLDAMTAVVDGACDMGAVRSPANLVALGESVFNPAHHMCDVVFWSTDAVHVSRPHAAPHPSPSPQATTSSPGHGRITETSQRAVNRTTWRAARAPLDDHGGAAFRTPTGPAHLPGHCRRGCRSAGRVTD